MITIRPTADRGHFDFGWLDTRHTFSFGDYRDAKHMGFRALRVINEDVIAPATGFGEHPHADMEIITFVVSGELAHGDRIGEGHQQTLRPGEVQRISAGTGIVHSEFNASRTNPAHILQVWIRPDRKGHEPRYDQKEFPLPDRRGRLVLVASPDGTAGSLPINRDARVYASILPAAAVVEHSLSAGRGAWIQLVRGRLDINGRSLAAGDGAAIEDERSLRFAAEEEAEFVLFDLD